MTASACSSRRAALRVNRSGSPGPAPTRYTLAVRATRLLGYANLQQERRSYGALILLSVWDSALLRAWVGMHERGFLTIAGKPVRFASEQNQSTGKAEEREGA